jgi:two-component system, NarL family, invasion response regulator UvrY
VKPLLQQLRNAIEELTPQNVDKQKDHILALLTELAPFHPNGDGDDRHKKLSPRERQVMSMLLTGRRLKEIAVTLDISVKTVTTHRSRLLRKLGVEDNLGLYRYAVRNGLMEI